EAVGEIRRCQAQLRHEVTRPLQLEFGEVGAVQRSQHREQVEHRLDDDLVAPQPSITALDDVLEVPEWKELPVPLDHRALKLVAVADALAPSVDQLLAAEGKPLEETHDDLRQRRAQLLASRDAVELLLASRNRQVAELALDPRELERLAEVGRLVLERDANQ